MNVIGIIAEYNPFDNDIVGVKIFSDMRDLIGVPVVEWVVFCDNANDVHGGSSRTAM